MNKQEFEIKMKQHEVEFNKLMDAIKTDVIFFADLNPSVTTYDLNTTSHFSDNICESGAWIIDKINGEIGSKKSLVKKIRKALGFTYP